MGFSELAGAVSAVEQVLCVIEKGKLLAVFSVFMALVVYLLLKMRS